MNVFSGWFGQSSTPQLLSRRYECTVDGEKRVYIELKKLGSGGFGDVYKVEREDTRTFYALKLMRGLDDYSLQKAMKEVTVMSQIKGPNIVKYEHHFLMDDGDRKALCVVMQLASMDLDKFIHREGPLPYYLAFTIFLQIVESLAHLHSKELIVHRDLKPGNILLNLEPLEVLIADFGLAYEVTHENQTLDFNNCGTPGFKAPEILNGSKQHNKVDTYSAGLILYLMLTGDKGFTKASCWEAYAKKNPKILEEKIHDSGIRNLLDLMLCTNPDKRLTLSEVAKSSKALGWTHALRDKLDIKEINVDYVGAFVSLIQPNERCLRRVYIHLLTLLKDEVSASLLLEYPLIHNICNVITTKSNSSRSKYTFLKKLGYSNSQMLKYASMDRAAISLLSKLLSLENLRGRVVNELLTSGFFPILLEKFKAQSEGMDEVMMYVCSVPFASTYLLHHYGFKETLYGLLTQGNCQKYVDKVFQSLQYHSSFDAKEIEEFLKYYKSFNEVRNLIMSSENSNELISEGNIDTWKQIIRHIQIDIKSISCLQRLIYPMKDMHQFLINSGVCIRNIGYCTKEMMKVTTMCSPCAQRHSIDSILIDSDPNTLGCGCLCSLPPKHLILDGIKNKKQYPVSYYNAKNTYLVHSNSEYKYRTHSTESLEDKFIIPHCGIEIIHNPLISVQFYAEIKVKNFGKNFTVGFKKHNHVSTSFPLVAHTFGKELGEMGYSNDGKLQDSLEFKNAEKLFGPSYGYNDIIGIGVTGDGFVFYTKNGSIIGITSIRLRENTIYHVAIGIQGSGTFSLTTNIDKFKYQPPINKDWNLNEFAVDAIFSDNLEIFNLFCNSIKSESKEIIQGIGILLLSLKSVNSYRYKEVITKFPVLNNLEYPELYSHYLPKDDDFPIESTQEDEKPKDEKQTYSDSLFKKINEFSDANDSMVWCEYKEETKLVVLPPVKSKAAIIQICAATFHLNPSDVSLFYFDDKGNQQILSSDSILTFGIGQGWPSYYKIM